MSGDAAEREAIIRAERALDDAYSRYAGLEEPVRVAGLAEALQQVLATEPAALRAPLLDQLERRNSLPPPSSAGEVSQPPSGNTAEMEELRHEIERLKRELSTAPSVAAAGADRALLEALLGSEVERLGKSVDAARVIPVVQALAAFARDMVKGFLSDPGKPGDSIVQLDRFRTSLNGELSGARAGGTIEALLDETTRRVGVQLEAFSVACVRGAKSLLGELGPEVLEDAAGDGGFGPFKYRGMWETFVRRQHELADADDLFENYFDPALRNAMYQLREKK